MNGSKLSAGNTSDTELTLTGLILGETYSIFVVTHEAEDALVLSSAHSNTATITLRKLMTSTACPSYMSGVMKYARCALPGAKSLKIYISVHVQFQVQCQVYQPSQKQCNSLFHGVLPQSPMKLSLHTSLVLMIPETSVTQTPQSCTTH